MVEELHELQKLFLTPDAEDQNPLLSTFSMNETSILDFNSEMADMSNWKTDICMYI